MAGGPPRPGARRVRRCGCGARRQVDAILGPAVTS